MLASYSSMFLYHRLGHSGAYHPARDSNAAFTIFFPIFMELGC
jgi:hypothetical protein